MNTHRENIRDGILITFMILFLADVMMFAQHNSNVRYIKACQQEQRHPVNETTRGLK